ncbi:MAG TPA: hypothetical protein VFV22_02530 [Candidatus Paceibacterota bacterium]|nr:hypothetical protein [Candidatus Paceibacterota bacterium]
MNIQENAEKFKDFMKSTDVLLVLTIITTAVASFFLGKSSVLLTKNTPDTEGTYEAVEVGQQANHVQLSSTTSIAQPIIDTQARASGAVFYVASRGGTKYHLPWCAGAKQIKEENKITFNTKEDAELAGYTPASNCKGI